MRKRKKLTFFKMTTPICSTDLNRKFCKITLMQKLFKKKKK